MKPTVSWPQENKHDIIVLLVNQPASIKFHLLIMSVCFPHHHRCLIVSRWGPQETAILLYITCLCLMLQVLADLCKRNQNSNGPVWLKKTFFGERKKKETDGNRSQKVPNK